MDMNFFETAFGGDFPHHPLTLEQSALRAVFMYLAGLMLIRMGKNRLMGRNSTFDVLMGFTLGSLLSRGINGSAALSGSIAASAALVGMHWVFSVITYKHDFAGKIFKGNPVPIVRQGITLPQNMRRFCVSHKDLDEALRLNANLGKLSDVAEAYVERNGDIGIVRKEPQPRVMEISVENGVKTVRIEWASS